MSLRSQRAVCFLFSAIGQRSVPVVDLAGATATRRRAGDGAAHVLPRHVDEAVDAVADQYEDDEDDDDDDGYHVVFLHGDGCEPSSGCLRLVVERRSSGGADQDTCSGLNRV